MIKQFTKDWFFYLDSELRKMGLDSDDKSFDEIKEILQNKTELSAEEFTYTVAYVILAGGFSQKTAKRIHQIIINKLPSFKDTNELLMVFNNKNKINAIVQVWENRQLYRDGYYKLKTLDEKIAYLQTLPHIGKITANHLARNLGEDIVKYDIWIQRLGAMYIGNKSLIVDNGSLNSEVKIACDNMFNCLVKETGLPRGYIDVVLWKACQNHLIEL